MFITRNEARRMVFGLLCYLPTAFAAQDPQAILSASDAIRNPTQSFSLTTQLLDYQNGKQKDATTVVVYSRPDPRSGQYRSLLRFTAPERDAGRIRISGFMSRPAKPAYVFRRSSACWDRPPTAM